MDLYKSQIKAHFPADSFVFPLQISNGIWFCQLKLHYFDHLLQENVTGVATCQNPAMSLQLAPPLVTCRKTEVAVKLPVGTRLKRIKALGKDGVAGRLHTKSLGLEYVQISTAEDKVRNV